MAKKASEEAFAAKPIYLPSFLKFGERNSIGLSGSVSFVVA